MLATIGTLGRELTVADELVIHALPEDTKRILDAYYYGEGQTREIGTLRSLEEDVHGLNNRLDDTIAENENLQDQVNRYKKKFESISRIAEIDDEEGS